MHDGSTKPLKDSGIYHMRANHGASECSERLKIQEAIAQAIFRNLTLVNGGAVIALFTFIGNANAAAMFQMNLLWTAFGVFAVGLASTLAAALMAYLMQVQYYYVSVKQMWNDQCSACGFERVEDHTAESLKGKRYEVAAICAAVVGLVAFCAGSALALAAVG